MHRRTAALLVALLLLVSCKAQKPKPEAPEPKAEFPVTVTDDDGIEVTLSAAPERIVTFAPSNTEIVFALGLADRLVGVSGAFDDYPPEATEIEQIGGAGEFGVDPNVEKVVSLEPDLLLAIGGGDTWKERLRELEVPVFTLNATSLDDLLGDIENIGRLTGAVSDAATVTEEMRSDAAEIGGSVAAEDRVSCFFEVSPPPSLFTVGPNTFIADLLERAGCDSVSGDATTDYPEWSVEQLVADDPDVYLVSSEAGVSVDAVGGRPGYDGLGAVTGGRVHLIDSDLVSRPGPRVVEGLRLLADALHAAA